MNLLERIGLLMFLGACSCVGFMMTLPKVFRYYNNELHAVFYLGATVVTSFLFPKRWGILSVGLFTFGLFIEKAQEYSKRIRLPYLGRVVHGNFDPEDVQYNLLGILLGLVIFHSYQKIRKSKV
ncbi:MAG: hypothetical protein ACK438_06615 [Flavobacteriales bacterium]|jgi:hypothetical protein